MTQDTQKPEIFIDMDGVVADFVGAVCEVFCSPASDVTTWNFFREWGYSPDEFWGELELQGESFWATLEHLPMGITLTDFVLRYPCDYWFLTTPSRSSSCYSGKHYWLRDYLGDVNAHTRLIIMAEKWRMSAPGRILIDDNDQNVEEWIKRGGHAVLWPQPWNSSKLTQEQALTNLKEYLDDWNTNQRSGRNDNGKVHEGGNGGYFAKWFAPLRA